MFSLALLSVFQELFLTDLHAESTYSVTVAAYTTKGDGARSKPKLVTTTGAGRLRVICPSVWSGTDAGLLACGH